LSFLKDAIVKGEPGDFFAAKMGWHIFFERDERDGGPGDEGANMP
jgi:hypothetical protein